MKKMNSLNYINFEWETTSQINNKEGLGDANATLYDDYDEFFLEFLRSDVTEEQIITVLSAFPDNFKKNSNTIVYFYRKYIINLKETDYYDYVLKISPVFNRSRFSLDFDTENWENFKNKGEELKKKKRKFLK